MPLEPPDWLKRIDRYVWAPHLAALPAWQKRIVRVARLVVVLVRDVVQGDLTLWTMSLVYTTLLSMVPLLALSFSVLKAFGVHNQIEPLLENVLAPLGEQGHEITSRLIQFIERVNVGVLGALGLALLVYTVISLMQKIEEVFNAIWHVTQPRGLGERYSRYLSTLLIGPLLVFAALGITAGALSSHAAQEILTVEPLGRVFYAAGTLVPYVLVIGAFTFFYVFVPNTRVRFAPALAAATIAGVLWQTAGWAFAAFVVSSTRYSAIYSSFAILVLFLIWLYVSWLVLLIGAAVSFYLQCPEYLYAKPGEPRLSNRMRERLALAVMYVVGQRFVSGQPPWTLHELTRRFDIPMHSANDVLDALVSGGLLRQTNDNPPGYLPARDLARMAMAELLATVRRAGEDAFLNPDALPLAAAVERVMEAVERSISSSTENLSVAALVGDGDRDTRASALSLDAAPPAPGGTHFRP